MTLTPEDVHKKTFTPVRLREGYDKGEVDQFLDEVETELIRLHQENDELRTKLETSTSTPSSVPATSTSPSEPTESTAPVPAPPAVRTVPEAASAAARLLEIATNNADQLVNEARSTAERLETEAKEKTEQLEAEARTRAEQLDSETGERRQQLLGELERDREAMTRELEDLRSFEREYRTRLKGYFEAQLQALDGEGDGNVPLTPLEDRETTPSRLRELLGEDA
jgi:DivIVA domain-containing protein